MMKVAKLYLVSGLNCESNRWVPLRLFAVREQAEALIESMSADAIKYGKNGPPVSLRLDERDTITPNIREP